MKRENHFANVFKSGFHQLHASRDSHSIESEQIAELTESRDQALLALEQEKRASQELEYQKYALDEHAVVTITDTRGRIIYVNDKFCQLSGYTREELLGQTHGMLKSGEHSKAFYKELWKTIASGQTWTGEVKNKAKRGGYYWVKATIVPFRDLEGEIIKYVAIRADITESKMHEKQLEETNAALSNALFGEKASMAKLKVAMDELGVLASTDKLTGLPNRAVFTDRLSQAIKDAHRNKKKHAVLFFDFDRFKVVNDSLGHDVGDALLCSIAKKFNSQLRENDTVARFGGDEFVVLLTNLERWEDAEFKAIKLRDEFAKPHHLGDHLIVSTASIGLITNQHADQSPGEMIRDADTAMYFAKAHGKNRVVVFDQQMHKQATDRLMLEEDLRTAVKNKELQLYYQPIIELANGNLKGFEALIRWEHAKHGFISPEVFIPIAEDSELINEIGNGVIHTAAKQVNAWNQMFGPGQRFTVNVNVSKRQLLQPDFLDRLLQCRAEFDLHASQLPIEITESVIVDARSDIVPLLHQIRSKGFPIVMDDFGTGVSSLSALHAYPIDVLKIDQSFINVLNGDRSLLAVVSAITNLAQNLGIQTVAEGVETDEIVGVLQSFGCDFGQGYFFAKPLTATQAEDFIGLSTQRKNLAA